MSAETKTHFHEAVPYKYWVLTIFAVFETILVQNIGNWKKLQIPAAHQGYFQTLESPSQGQEYFMWGFFRPDCTSCVPNRVVTYFSSFICWCLAALSLHTWICRANPRTETKRWRGKCSSGAWCFLEEAIFGHTGLPVYPHHIRGPQTLPVQLGHTRRIDIHPFLRIPLIRLHLTRLTCLYLKLPVGLMKIFFIISLDKIVILFDR